MTEQLTVADVPAVLQALLAKATVPGPPLRKPYEEPRTWFLLAVHPDDEAEMSARVAADVALQALVTVKASVRADPGMAYFVDQDKAFEPLNHIGYWIYPEPARPMPAWLRDDLYYSAMVRKPMDLSWVAGLT